MDPAATNRLPVVYAAVHESGYDAVDGSSTGTSGAMDVGAVKAPTISEERAMQTITTIGLDVAKSVFQVHGIDAGGQVVIRRQLKRRHVLTFFEKLPPCLVGIESLRLVSPLVERTAGTWPYRAVDAAGLREALRQATEERHG